jgi:hypothetical protein
MAEAIRDDVFIKALTGIILPSRAGKHTGKKVPKARPKAKIHLSAKRVNQEVLAIVDKHCLPQQRRIY